MVKRYDTPVGYMDEHKEGFYVEYEDYAALRAKLAELAQCRDHWKTSYEDVRAKLKQAEDNRDLYFDDLNITKTTLHLAEKALAAQDAELVLAAKVMDTCEETMRHVLNYVEGQGLSAEQDVKESIELIHMFRDAEVVRRLEGERTMNCLGGGRHD